MDDVIAGGTDGDKPRRAVPRALRIAALVAVGAAVVAFVVARHGAKRQAASTPSPTQPPSTVASASRALPDGGVVAENAAPWPSATGACGTKPYAPISEFETQFATPYAPTNATFVIGGNGLRRVTLSPSGFKSTAIALPGLAATADRIVNQVLTGPDSDYAVVSSCNGTDQLTLYRLSAESASLVPNAAFGQLMTQVIPSRRRVSACAIRRPGQYCAASGLAFRSVRTITRSWSRAPIARAHGFRSYVPCCGST